MKKILVNEKTFSNKKNRQEEKSASKSPPKAVHHVPSECQLLLQKLLWPVVNGNVLGSSATKLLSKWASTVSISTSAFSDASNHKRADKQGS